jgi:hypothetical protein
MPPTDPVIYRLYEVRCGNYVSWRRLICLISPLQGVLVYGQAIKVGFDQFLLDRHHINPCRRLSYTKRSGNYGLYRKYLTLQLDPSSLGMVSCP